VKSYPGLKAARRQSTRARISEEWEWHCYLAKLPDLTVNPSA